MFLLALFFAHVLSAMQAVPQFTVSLSSPPSQRWQGAVQAVLEKHTWEESFGATFASHNKSLFNRLTSSQWEVLATSVKKFNPDYAEELQSISDSFAKAGHVVTFEYLCGWVWFHELAHTLPQNEKSKRTTHECTGIIAQDEATNVYHARNMDQTPASVRNITLHITFVQNTSSGQEETVFVGVDWYWITAGVMTAVKKGVASLQENWRITPPMDVVAMFSQISSGITPQMYLFRNILTSTLPSPNAFNTVVQYLSSTALAAPLYFVVGGSNPREGIIITRNNSDAMNFVHMPSEISATNFSIVQTNYDPWLPDNPRDPRRTAAQVFLANLQQNEAASQLGLFAVLSSPPVLNSDTAYSVIMRAATGELHPFIRS